MKVLVLSLALVSFAAVAATPKVTTDSDPSANFSSYKTYYWAMKPEGGSPLMQQRIVEGIDARLKAKGWSQAEGGDVAVAAHVSTSQKQSLDTFYTGTGMGGWGWRGGWGGAMAMGNASTTVHTYDVGTLVVDMFDAKSKQAVWRGTATGTVPSNPDKVEAGLDKGLDKMFASFPPTPKTK
ncbi:DUF4136 domain-containing protein [Lysobacter sp. S4-A87]|uniref:DUF4136 domain-containing protein n=1 Tax=Lysobacter sp. S4-A87 TaxID=2925843 RepID=UPI001F538322|nr:DUF4136 domain-containing protein [Lysobacter sp. S4-A87]UNK49926.1 DUF4136 domain-containing protein [Lysobacter sp. S4-A87]